MVNQRSGVGHRAIVIFSSMPNLQLESDCESSSYTAPELSHGKSRSVVVIARIEQITRLDAGLPAARNEAEHRKRLSDVDAEVRIEHAKLLFERIDCKEGVRACKAEYG